MKFEEALTSLRLGAKIRHPHMNNDEYLMRCYVGLNAEMCGMKPENFEDIKERGMSIVKMKGETQHPDMYYRLPIREAIDLLKVYPYLREKILTPTINLLLIMSDEWEIYDEEMLG